MAYDRRAGMELAMERRKNNESGQGYGNGYDLARERRKKKEQFQDLVLADGTNFGKITGYGMDAIQDNALDRYTPGNDTEKETLNKYKNYLNNQMVEVANGENNPTIKIRYGNAKRIDDVFESNKNLDADSLSKTAFQAFADLRLSGEEYNNAYAYLQQKKAQFGIQDQDLNDQKNDLNHLSNEEKKLVATYTTKELYDMIQDNNRKIKKLRSGLMGETLNSSKISDLKSKNETLENARTFRQQADDAKTEQEYSSLVNREDFDEKSAVIDNNDLLRNGRVLIASNPELAAKIMKDREDNFLYSPVTVDPFFMTGKYGNMAEDERKKFRYLVNTEGVESGNRYLDSLERELNARSVKKGTEWLHDMSKNHKVLSSAASLVNATGIGAASAGVGILASKQKERKTGRIEPLDPNADSLRITRANETIRTSVSEDMNWWQNLLYQSGMAIGDVVVSSMLARGIAGAGTAGGLSALNASAKTAGEASKAAKTFKILDNVAKQTSLGIMSSNAAASAAYDIANRGGSARQAIARGTEAALIEYATEMIGIDHLFHIANEPAKTWGNSLKEILKQSGAEGLEEVLSEILNNISDQKLMGTESNYDTEVAQYKKNGYSEKEAKNKAFFDLYVKNPLYSGVVGAVSGAGLGAGATIKGTADVKKAQSSYGKLIKETDSSYAVILTGLESGKETESYQLAKQLHDKLQSGKKITENELGKLYLENVFTIQEEDLNMQENAVPSREENSAEKMVAHGADAEAEIQLPENGNADSFGETGKASDQTATAQYALENVSDEVKRLDDLLRAKGSDNASRQEIISSATEIEQKIPKEGIGFGNVLQGISKITSNAVSAIEKNTGVSGSYWNLFGENLKAVLSENPEGSLTARYSDAYTTALKNRNPEKYGEVFLSSDGTDLSNELPKTILNNQIPQNVKNAGLYRLEASRIKKIVQDVSSQISNVQASLSGSQKANAKNSVQIMNFRDVETSEKGSDVTTDSNNDVRKAQFYNVMVSNLKNKAEQLGLTDRAFYNNLQNINLYNPSESDKALISREFNRIFAGNTDTLTESWLNAIDTGKHPATAINEENTSANEDTANTALPNTKTNDIMSTQENGTNVEVKSNGQETADLRNATSGSTDRNATGKRAENKREQGNGKAYSRIDETAGEYKIACNSIPHSSYSDKMKQIQNENNAFGFQTVFTDGNTVTINASGDVEFVYENGCYNKHNATIYINSNAADIDIINKHERVHAIKRMHPDIYNQLKESVMRSVAIVPFHQTSRAYLEILNKSNAKATIDEGIEELLCNLSYEIESDHYPEFVADREAIQKAYQDFYREFSNHSSVSDNATTKISENVTETKYDHLYDEEKVSKEYLDSVNPEIENAVISIRNGDIDSVPDVINVTELDEKTIKAISDFVGYDVSGYVCKIERDRLVHVENRHGINGKHDHSLSDPKDTARMGYVVNNSDNIDWVVDGKGNKVFDEKYNDRYNNKSPVFIMEKRIDRTYSVSQVVPDSKRKTLWVTSARIEKADVGSQVPNADNSPQPTSKTPLVSSSASDNSIAQDNKIVNSTESMTENTANFTDRCELIATKHTATGDDIWVVSLKDRLSPEEYKDLSRKVKSVGGYYSRFAKTPDGKAIPGFVFRTEPTAKELNVFNDFFGYTEETTPAKNKSGIKEVDVNALLGAEENANPGEEIKLSDYEKQNSTEQASNNQPENDIMEKKPDLSVGDIIEYKNKRWRVTDTGFNMTFENIDKDDKDANFSHIGGMDDFKKTHDYKVIKDGAKDVHNRVLERKSGDDNGIRKSEPVSETEEKRNIKAADREFGEDVASESGTHIQSSEAETSAAEQHDSGDNNDRVRKSDDGDGNSGTGIGGNNNVDVTDTNGKSKDFVITRTVAEAIDKSAPSITDNIQAIETLHAIEKSGKAPTKTQQGLLSKFKGWGGLTDSFYGENRMKLQELMSESELKAAQSTVNDAYFTPTGVIDGIYKGLSHLGFEGGNILEPSMGVGNFFGRMPKAIKDNSSLFGVEIDSISGRIAQCLYPSANIEIAPFQEVAYKDGAFDLIIGNVPFGEVKYNYKGKKYLIHDYFFVKAMDRLNDGGVLMFLTTKGTLDKLDSTARTELSNRGKLLGAYRLPSDVFTKSAGASVVTDLIIMQKTSDTNGESFINLDTVAVGDGEFSVNEYFANHPENIIGKLTSRRDWRSGKEVLDVVSSGNVTEQLVKAIRKLPKNLLSGIQTVGSVNVTENNAPVQTFTAGENDTVEYVDTVTGDVKQIKGKSAKIAKDYVALKEVYQELVDATLSDYETDYIESKRKTLNTVYDGFVKKHGALEKNKKLLSADNDFYKLSGLEVYDTKTKKIVKSEMFTKDTLGKRKPKKADSVLDALSISIGETGGVNINRIAGLTGVSENEAIKQLDDRIVYTPDGTYELNEVYLSGNVREKYEAVKGKKGFEKNEKMLEAVIPADIPAKDITPQFGAPWIKPDYVAGFLKETFHLYNKPTVNYDPTSGTWSVSGNTWGDNTLLTNKYGTKYMDAVKIAEKALNMRRIVVTDKDTKRMLVVETRAAQQKAEDIKATFEEWCFKDANRRKDLVETFNRKFNSNRNMDFSELAKYLTFDGLTDTFKLRDYQKRAVARAVFNGNTLLAHGVGTGKTAEMIAIAMELKRMGMAKKNMMVVPNHKVADFRNDILKMYPAAKVAFLEKGANPVQRQRFYALVASNDFDIVIIPHSAFGMLDVSADTKRAFINNQISELEEVLTAAQAEKGKIDGRFISNLENQKKRLEEKLKFVTESAKDSGNVFEELGVDSLFVDEAHNFKNLPFYSKLSRVAGVSINQPNNKTRASRAENMFMITDYLNRNGGRITFGTATPITNSMSEIYNMTRFLRPDILADSGLQSFDAWASMFGSIVNQAEVDPSGRNMRMKERFSKFKNVSQMIEQFRRMADILKTGDVIQELPEAERIDVYSEPNEIQEEFLDIVDEMIDDIRANGQRADHNMLEVTTAGQMAAIDLRLVASYFDDKYSLDELNLPNNRTSRVAKKVYKEYVDSNEAKGTQFIFCDKGVHDNPDAKYGFYVYGDLINKLVALGIPRNEIAIAQEFEDKADLSAKVNTGEIRVLIGSTAVMGEGMNAQNKAVALHHMTVPDRPSDIEQREGRIIRYGNENKKVRIYRYIQEKSYDSYQWQMQERKAGFINQALSGGTVSELEEMSDFQLSAREAKAISSGNPLLLEKIEIEDKLNNLKSIRNKFNTDKLEMQDRLAVLPSRIAKKEKIIADTAADVKTVQDNTPKDFEITLGKTKYTERAKATEALKRGLANAPRNGTHIKIGSYRGLDLYYTSSFDKGTHFILKGSGEYSALGGDSASGNITRITNLAEKIGETLEADKALVGNYKAEIETLKKEVDAEFPRTKELEELQAKLNDIDTQLGINVSEVDMSDVIVDDEAGNDDVESSRDIADDDGASRWTTERAEGGKAKGGVTLSDIIDEISEKFDIPISSGKVTDREASGIYKKQAESIRTRIANNLPTVSHELGHHLDKQYELSLLASVDEIKGIVSDEFLDKYPADKINGELVAEFVRLYLKNANEANRLCPDFYFDFIHTLSKEDLKAVNEVASSVNEYMSYNISERYDSAIVSSQKKEKLPFRDKWHKWYSDWVDSFHPQKEAIDYVKDVTKKDLSGNRNAYVLATNSLNAHNVANFLICDGFRDLNGNVVDAKSFVDSIGMIHSKDVKLLDKYLVLRHSLEWIAPKQEDVTSKRVFADDTLENTDEINRQIAEIERKHPEIKTAAENLYEYQNNLLKYFVVPAGGMTEDTLATLNRKYPDYVPFYRSIGKASGLAKGTFANQRSPIMRAKGSGELIISPTESIIRNTEKMVKFAMRNQVMRAWSEYADNVDGFGKFMEKVTPDMIPHLTDITNQKNRFADALQQIAHSGEDYFAVSDLFDEIFGDSVEDFTPIANAKKKIVTVMKNGKASYYQIHDEAFYNSVAELSPKQTSGLLSIMNNIMQPMKLLITQNNPIFAATNALRDFGTAYKLSEINNPVTFATQYIKALGGIISNSENYLQYKAMGGGHTSELSANIEDISKTLRRVAQKDVGKARRLAYSVFVHPVETVATINDAVESIPRFMEFQRTLQNGGDLQDAIFNADDITTNFKRSGKGDTAKAVNKLIMFNNAAIQGIDKMFRTIKDPEKRYKYLLKHALNALILGIIGYIYNKAVDEEGYKNLSSYKKNNFYNYAIGDGKFLSLPKPRENALLDTFTERTIEYLFSNNKEAFYGFGNYLSSQLLPPMLPDTLHPIEAFHSVLGSTVLGGLADVGFNRDFKGTPIEGEYEKYVPSNERYNDNTTELAYWIGQTKLARDWDISPKKIDHLISSYTGILGQVNKALFPISDSRRDVSIGLRNKFISDSNYSTDVLNKMYENQEKAKKAFLYQGTVEKAVEYEQNAILTSYISGMNKAVKALPVEEQRNGRAYLLKSLNSWDYGNTASQEQMIETLSGENVSDKCIITSVPKSKLEWTNRKVKYSYQMTPQEYEIYVKEYLTMIEKYRTGKGVVGSGIDKYVSQLEKADQEVKERLNNKYKSLYKNKATKEKQ